MVAWYNYEQILVLSSDNWRWECGIKKEVYGSWPCPLEALKQLKGHSQNTSRIKGKIKRASGKAVSADRKGGKVGDGDQLGRLRKGFLDTRGKVVE